MKNAGWGMAWGLLLWLGLAPAAQAELFDRCDSMLGDMPGPEDIDLDRTSAGAPRLLVSSYDRRNHEAGGIWAIALKEDTAGEAFRMPITGRDPGARSGCPLRPHGISIVRSSADEATRLYVINHAQPEDAARPGCDLDVAGERQLHSVVIFRVEQDRLVQEKTLADPALPSPNDLLALDNGHVYVTNEVTSQGFLRSLLELGGLAHYSNVVELAPSASSTSTSRVVATGMRYANGIARAAGRLFVAGLLDQEIFEFETDPASGRVGKLLRRIPVESGVDNLTWRESRSGERLIAAAHPSIFRFLRYLSDASHPSPSEVYEIDLTHDPVQVERIFSDNGKRISAVSTGLIYKQHLYLGQVFGRGVLDCVSSVAR